MLGWKRLGGLVVVAAISFETQTAYAQDVDEGNRSAARDLGYEGVDLLQKGDAAAASERLERAYEVLRVPTIGLWSARALVANGKLLEGSERYIEVSRLPVTGDASVQESAKADAAREREALLPRVPTLVIKLDGAPDVNTQVLLDGAPVPRALWGVRRPVNPGQHVVSAGSATQTVQVQEGESKNVVLGLWKSATVPAPPRPVTSPPAPAPAADRRGDVQRKAGWALLGVGGAGLVLGAVTAGLAVGKRSSISQYCDGRDCYPPSHATVDAYNTLRTTSTVGFIVAGVAAGGGLALLLTAPKPYRAGLTLRGSVGLSSVALQGAF